MHGASKQIGRLALFGDAAGIHDRKAVGEASDDREVVRNPDESSSPFARELLHDREDLRLDGDIKCRGRFIGDNEIR